MNYKNKLENLMAITKPYALRDRFMLIKDAAGWTDGYIADLTDRNTDQMKLVASCKAKTMIQCVLNKDEGPEIKGNIPNGVHAVENIALDLSDNNAILYNRTVAVKVNARYLKYFHATYKQAGGISDLLLTDPLQPIKVMVRGELVGLIMPIKNHTQSQ